MTAAANRWFQCCTYAVTQTGHLLAESTGEMTVAAPVLTTATPESSGTESVLSAPARCRRLPSP